MEITQALSSLRALGLNDLEARVYCHLVTHSPATGYRTAKSIGKPTANTYKALEALAQRGVVTREDDTARLYRAVPPDELLNSLERSFLEHRRRAAAGLAGLERAKVDHRVYPLTTRAQVIERLRRMLSDARAVAVLDLPGSVADDVREELAFAVESGVRVVARTDDDEEIPGVWMTPARISDTRTEELTAVSDRRELMIYEGDATKVNYAVWSANPTMARQWHLRQVSEMLYAEIEHGLDEGLTTDEVEQAVERYRTLREL